MSYFTRKQNKTQNFCMNIQRARNKKIDPKENNTAGEIIRVKEQKGNQNLTPHESQTRLFSKCCSLEREKKL